MTAAQLLADLRRRRIHLAVAAGGIHYEAPRGVVTSADREAVATHRKAIVELLRAEAEDPVPSSPCGLCGSPLTWVDGWAMAGDARWLCPRCTTLPAPSLVAVLDSLTREERRCLETEAAEGDALARAVLAELEDGR